MPAAARPLAHPQRPQQVQQRPAAFAANRPAPRRSRPSPTRAAGRNNNSGAGGTRMLVGEAQLRPTSPAGWEAMRAALREAGVSMVAPQELAGLRARGARLVDVRPSGDHAQRRIPGAHSAPIYRLIAGWSPQQVARRVGYALFGVLNGTEVNPDFLADVLLLLRDAAAAAGEGDGSPTSSSSSSSAAAATPKLILYCSQGGSIDAVGAAAVAAASGPVGGGAGGGARGARGWQSRSLIAAYALLAADAEEFGGGKVAVLRGGLSEWVRGGREVEGEAVGEEEEEKEERQGA